MPSPTQQLEAMRAALACGRSGCACATRGLLHCPAHDDRTPSLNVTVSGSKLLLKCHGGCSQEAVIDASRARGLWQTAETPTSAFTPARPARWHDEAIETFYDYRDQDRRVVYGVGRTPKKEFPIFHLEGDRWIPGLGGQQRILYRLPELLASTDLVYICEGEKDADRGRREGLTATTTPAGAGKSHLCDLEPLRGRHVVLVPDKDEAGAKHGDDLGRLLGPIAASVQRLELPEIARKDLSDFFDAGGTVDELQALITAMPDVEARAEAPHAASLIDWPAFWRKEHASEDFLLRPVLARGRSHALYAPAKGGKSENALEWAAGLATGRRVLDKPEGEPISVVYFDLEMTEDDLKERLVDMGYGPDDDLSNLHYYLLPSLPKLDTPEGGEAVLEIVRRHKAVLVVIDTTSRVLEGSKNDADTLRALYVYTGLPLKAEGFTVLRLDHSGKDPSKGQRGSSAKADDVDVVWELTRSEVGAVLKATHRRQSWIPEKVSLVRLDDPLRYEMSAEAWPAGTADLAQRLDMLGVPLDTSVNAARATLKDAGMGTRNDKISAAVRWRRRPEYSGNASGNAQNALAGNASGNGGHSYSGNGPVTAGNSLADNPVTFPPLKGERSESCPVCHQPLAPGVYRHPECVAEWEKMQRDEKARAASQAGSAQ